MCLYMTKVTKTFQELSISSSIIPIDSPTVLGGILSEIVYTAPGLNLKPSMMGHAVRVLSEHSGLYDLYVCFDPSEAQSKTACYHLIRPIQRRSRVIIEGVDFSPFNTNESVASDLSIFRIS